MLYDHLFLIKTFKCLTVLSNSLVSVGFSYERVHLDSLLTDSISSLEIVEHTYENKNCRGLNDY